MKPNAFKQPTLLIASGVICFFCVVQVFRPGFFERLERMTFDMRVRQAVMHYPPSVATNLGFVNISDETISAVNRRLLGPKYGLYWPRHVYARVADELAEKGAKVIAFDVLFGEERTDHSPLSVGSERVESDDFLARKLKKAGNVIIAAEQKTVPPTKFRTNALALGDITADKDLDGVLRRARAYRDYYRWHKAFQQVEDDPEYGVDLRKARIEANRIILTDRSGDLPPIPIPLTNGNFDLLDFVARVPAGMERFEKPFTVERVWHMGIVIAASELKLDLAAAKIELEKGRITLRGEGGVQRVIPVDANGYFYINWCIPITSQALTREPFEGLLAENQMRQPGNSNTLVALLAGRWGNKIDWRGKLAVIGSTATGNDLADRGATPLAENSFLVSKHWNVANSILTGQFVRRSSLTVELLMIMFAGAIAASLTLRFRSYVALIWVLVAAVAYTMAAFFAYVQFRYWMPIVLPLTGGMLIESGCLLAYLVIFEQKERRRLRSVFTKMVPSEVVAELEARKTDQLSLSGARRNVTVLFADIRGFTEMTDINRERAADEIKKNNLKGEAAEAVFDAQARETLDTVNQYLKVMAETVQKHKGAVDKFIGDCVMAFWGAPIPTDKHALACVRAAIDTQRAVFRLNQERETENKRREAENVKLAAAGRSLLPMLPILVVGSGINTGVVTAGYMGSDERLNYTVFGRDVNLASRLESVSGRGRIIISEATLAEIIQDDPTLALSCVELPPVKVKGIRNPVPIYEVPWHESGSVPPPDTGPSATTGGYETSFMTGIDNPSG